MTDPVFVQSRHVYDSYQDYWRMVELAGFPTCYNDELDPASDNTYIIAVRNGENEAGWPGARARIIHWHLEFHVEYGPWAGIAETWSPDAWHARTIDARYVPMGGDARLNEGTNGTAQAYDVAYLGYIVNRRNDVLTDLKAHGLRVSPTGAWGQERHAILTHSKVYLHVHQTDHAPAIPALRMVVAAAYKLPVIMETPADRGIYVQGYFLTSERKYMAEFCEMWVTDSSPFIQNFGYAIHDLLCDRMPFRKSTEDAL